MEKGKVLVNIAKGAAVVGNLFLAGCADSAAKPAEPMAIPTTVDPSLLPGECSWEGMYWARSSDESKVFGGYTAIDPSVEGCACPNPVYDTGGTHEDHTIAEIENAVVFQLDVCYTGPAEAAPTPTP